MEEANEKAIYALAVLTVILICLAPIYGCRPINFIHDQFLVEAPETRGDAAANVTGLLMDRAGEEILPDVPVKCEPILARRWSKRAGKIKDKEGRLLAWELDVLKKPG